MSVDARARIDSHRLMKAPEEARHEARIESARLELEKKRVELSRRWKRRAWIHAGIFVLSFVCSVGVFTLGTLLWVEPDDFLTLVLVAIASSMVFVGSFAWARMVILHMLLNDYQNKEEDPGMRYHFAKSVAYGFVALVLALVLAGLIVNIASAGFPV